MPDVVLVEFSGWLISQSQLLLCLTWSCPILVLKCRSKNEVKLCFLLTISGGKVARRLMKLSICSKAVSAIGTLLLLCWWWRDSPNIFPSLRKAVATEGVEDTKNMGSLLPLDGFEEIPASGNDEHQDVLTLLWMELGASRLRSRLPTTCL